MNKDLGGPAFPNEGGHKFASGNDVRKTLPHPGMTLRDYFAAKALGGLLADTAITASPELVAKVSYEYADAMLKERNK
jgi:hypothetical protein